MSAIDILILVVLAAAAFFGYTKGAVRQIGSVAGVVVGYIAAKALGARAGIALLMPQADAEAEATADAATAAAASTMTQPVAEILGSVIVFTAAFIAVYIIARVLRGAVSMAGLGPLDSLAGAVLSAAKWFLAVSIVLNLLVHLSPGNSFTASSRLLGGQALKWIIDFFPWLMGVAGFN